jgi:hypothetical protein
MRPIVLLIALATIGSNIVCGADKAPAKSAEDKNWIGAYSSPSEIAGFTGTVISIEKCYLDGLRHRMTYYTDVVSDNAIEQSELSDNVRTDGDSVYIATASGFYSDGKPVLVGHIERYTRLKNQRAHCINARRRTQGLP